ncbi:MAG: hypothetical protein R3B97_05040 [Dehalococcoidia bacterium]
MGDAGRDAAALKVERRGGEIPATVFLAKQLGFRNADVLEIDLVEFVAIEHVDERTHGDARCLHVEQKVTDAAVLGRIGVRTGDEDAHIGAVCAGRPDLLAVDDVVVAIADCAGLERGEIGSGAGLTEELTPGIFAAEDAMEVAVFLLLRAVDHDRWAGPSVADPAGAGRTTPGELLVEDELLLHAEAAAAVFLGPVWRAPTMHVELRRPFLNEVCVARNLAAGAVEKTPLDVRISGKIGREVGIEKRADFVAESDLGRGVTKVHGLTPSGRWPGPGRLRRSLRRL